MTQSKIHQVVPSVEPPRTAAKPAPKPAEAPKRRPRRAPARPRKARAAEPGPDALKPRELRSVLDGALARMTRRAAGEEKPVPLPWPTLAEALGGGLWGGTAVTLVGDTGCGKTQWALQVAAHAAGSGIPVCYVAGEAAMDQVAPRLFALKGGHDWVDLYVGNTDTDTIDGLRESFAAELKKLPFHLLAGNPSRPGEPGSRAVAEWMRERYPETRPGGRPLLIIQDFVELVTGAGRDQEEFNDTMGRVAQEARLSAREFDVVVLIVSSTSREQRLNEEGAIGIHHERRQPRGLGRGNPARLLLTGKHTGDLERESDTVLVLAQEPEQREPEGATPPPEGAPASALRPGVPMAARPEPAESRRRLWCAVAKNRSGGRAWCAMRFDGSRYEEDGQASVQLPAEACATTAED